jgi:serine/threonine protein kinase
VPDVTDLRPGDPEGIGGYRVLSRLGAGGQGVVFLATSASGERVAIKQLRLEDERARERFVKEVAAARRVAPFCTAQVVDVELEGPSPYIISEYIDGPSLQQQIERHGPMAGGALQRLAIGTVTALAAIHQAGVVHRDFKPANVMLSSDGPRVIDFGIARDLSTDTTVTSRIFGTPAYMAPEQLKTSRIGPATDMFAWASVIAFAATGRAPFDAPHMAAIVYRITSGDANLTGVPADLLGVIKQCLDKDPNRRPSAQQVLARLLGRPAPEHDATDATRVLAEATGIVHQGPADSAGGCDPADPATLEPTTAFISDQAAPAAVEPTEAFTPTPTPTPTTVYPPTSPAPPDGSQPVPQPSAPTNGSVPQSAAGPRPLHQNSSSPNETVPPQARPWGEGIVDRPRPVPPTRPGQRKGAIIAVVLALLVIAVGSRVTNFGSNQPDRGSGNTPAPRQPATTVPSAFDGSWTGDGHQPPTGPVTWVLEIDLDEGKRTGSMKIEGNEFSCSGPLTFKDLSGEVLRMDSVVDDRSSSNCADTAVFSLTADTGNPEQLQFSWVDANNESNTAGGVLRKD